MRLHFNNDVRESCAMCICLPLTCRVRGQEPTGESVMVLGWKG